MPHDELVIDSPAAEIELALLKKLKVGSILKSGLFEALDVGLEWTCMEVHEHSWLLEGRFVGAPVFRIVIAELQDSLSLEVL